MVPSRRGFVIGCGAVAASAVFCGRLGTGEAAPFTNPLPIPRLIDAAASRHSVNLKAMTGRHAFIAGKPTRTYGYSAPILGPVVRVRRGDEVEMVVENHLDAATTVHWHGLLVPGHNDGGPQQLIQPGERRRPVLKIDQPATTLWFHPHPHGDTARQIYMGLAGMLIVDDGSDARLGLPRSFGVDDLPLVLQDRQFDADGSIGYDNKTLEPLDIAYGARGDTIIVNGAIAPVARVPAGVVRLRLLNAANAQNYELGSATGAPFMSLRPTEVSSPRRCRCGSLLSRRRSALRFLSTSRTQSLSCWRPAQMSKWVFSAGWRRTPVLITCP